MEYVEYVSKNQIVDNELLNKILDYNNILDIDTQCKMIKFFLKNKVKKGILR